MVRSRQRALDRCPGIRQNMMNLSEDCLAEEQIKVNIAKAECLLIFGLYGAIQVILRIT